jgi:hypothetical protein
MRYDCQKEILCRARLIVEYVSLQHRSRDAIRVRIRECTRSKSSCGSLGARCLLAALTRALLTCFIALLRCNRTQVILSHDVSPRVARGRECESALRRECLPSDSHHRFHRGIPRQIEAGEYETSQEGVEERLVEGVLGRAGAVVRAAADRVYVRTGAQIPDIAEWQRRAIED